VTSKNPLRRLAGVLDLPARVQAVPLARERLGDDAFVEALDALARAAARGASVADDDAMLACALWLADPGRQHLASLHEAATRGDHRVAMAMLADEPAHKRLSRHGRLPDPSGPSRLLRHCRVWSPPESMLRPYLDELMRIVHPWDDADYASERQVLLGAPSLPEWTRDYDSSDALGVPAEPEEAEDCGTWLRVPLPPLHVARQARLLAMHPDPSVIRALLRDRSFGAKDVVRVAARRPTTAAIVEELVAHLGWMARPQVRAAVVENPFTPTRTALLFLPTVRARLRSVATACVHPRVRALAKVLSGHGLVEVDAPVEEREAVT